MMDRPWYEYWNAVKNKRYGVAQISHDFDYTIINSFDYLEIQTRRFSRL